ncbi:hypothetical protein PYCCODRAFT_1439650 [Trametes coccinea BRFM310]|uniref:F-box domain-containing protein n=1 Tax=Trametes coccinea (strain BRFM310) TaxID=1353009 RepID=A0A1Y2IA56_TRAC3|nr:hypothetical protein PYCCODRAFT_1439650 [Trametes coccinea BRFM310]
MTQYLSNPPRHTSTTSNAQAEAPEIYPVSSRTANPSILQEDILHLIFQCFTLDQWYPYSTSTSSGAVPILDPSCTENERLRTLARSARVCTSFRTAALPVLWATLYDFTPLLRLISSCTKKRVGRTPGSDRARGPFIFKFKLDATPIASDELRRIAFYGSMIRTVAKHEGAHYQSRPYALYIHHIDPSSWVCLHAILHHGPKGHLLPNLRQLVAAVVSPRDLDLVPAVASPSLLDLELVLLDDFPSRPREGWQLHLEDRLSAVLTRLPNLTRFRLDFIGVHLSDKIASAIAQVVSLRTLDMHISLPIIGPAYKSQVLWMAMPSLSPLRHLKSLRLHSSGEVRVPLPSSAGTSAAPLFPSLREIEICPLDFAPRFYRWCELLQSKSVHRLALASVQYAGASSLREVCRVIAQSFPCLFSFSCAFVPDRETHALENVQIDPLRDVIAPLSSLYALQHLSIHTAVVRRPTPLISLADADLDAISDFWPGLRHLSLRGFDVFPSLGQSRDNLPHLFGISLSTVATLSIRCSDLKHLALPLLDVKPHRIGSKDTYPDTNHHLQYFDTTDISDGDYVTAACILDRIFPHVDVTAQLVNLSQRGATIRPLGKKYLMAYDDWRNCAQYRLFLGIALCQDGRTSDLQSRLCEEYGMVDPLLCVGTLPHEQATCC